MSQSRNHLPYWDITFLPTGPFPRDGSRGGGCQIDLLIQTPRSVYVVETKRRDRIGMEAVDVVRSKLSKIRFKGRKSIRTVLVHCGELAPTVRGSGFFDFLIPAEALLR